MVVNPYVLETVLAFTKHVQFEKDILSWSKHQLVKWCAIHIVLMSTYSNEVV